MLGDRVGHSGHCGLAGGGLALRARPGWRAGRRRGQHPLDCGVARRPLQRKDVAVETGRPPAVARARLSPRRRSGRLGRLRSRHLGQLGASPGRWCRGLCPDGQGRKGRGWSRRPFVPSPVRRRRRDGHTGFDHRARCTGAVRPLPQLATQRSRRRRVHQSRRAVAPSGPNERAALAAVGITNASNRRAPPRVGPCRGVGESAAQPHNPVRAWHLPERPQADLPRRDAPRTGRCTVTSSADCVAQARRNALRRPPAWNQRGVPHGRTSRTRGPLTPPIRSAKRTSSRDDAGPDHRKALAPARPGSSAWRWPAVGLAPAPSARAVMLAAARRVRTGTGRPGPGAGAVVRRGPRRARRGRA